MSSAIQCLGIGERHGPGEALDLRSDAKCKGSFVPWKLGSTGLVAEHLDTSAGLLGMVETDQLLAREDRLHSLFEQPHIAQHTAFLHGANEPLSPRKIYRGQEFEFDCFRDADALAAVQCPAARKSVQG